MALVATRAEIGFVLAPAEIVGELVRTTALPGLTVTATAAEAVGEELLATDLAEVGETDTETFDAPSKVSVPNVDFPQLNPDMG